VFETFNEDSIKTIMIAQQEARGLGHKFVGPEHIFLGLIGVNAGETCRTLKLKGISLDRARDEIEKRLGRKPKLIMPLAIEFNDDSKRILEQSWGEAQKLGHNYIGAEHLLLALVADPNGPVPGILEQFGETPCSMTKKVAKIMDTQPLDTESS